MAVMEVMVVVVAMEALEETVVLVHLVPTVQMALRDLMVHPDLPALLVSMDQLALNLMVPKDPADLPDLPDLDPQENLKMADILHTIVVAMMRTTIMLMDNWCQVLLGPSDTQKVSKHFFLKERSLDYAHNQTINQSNQSSNS